MMKVSGRTMKSRFFGPIQIGPILLSLTMLASCRVTSQAVVDSQQTKQYERLEIIYRAHPAAGPLFSSNPCSPDINSGIIQASATASNPPAPFQGMNWSKAELRIECPHPDGRQDYARVTLRFKPVECGHACEPISWDKRIEERSGVRRSRKAEYRARWFYDSDGSACQGETYTEMDLPKAELDAILAELVTHGFFAEHGFPADSESQLEVRLNRRWTSKFWNYEPYLDALTTRVYEEGTLRTSPVEITKPAPRRIWSLGNLRPAARPQ